MVLGGQFHVLILSVAPNAPAVLSGKLLLIRKDPKWTSSNPFQSHREPRVEPSHAACQLCDPASHVTHPL